MPSSPMTFLHGTRTSSKNTSAVSDDHIPILLILRATWTPLGGKTGNGILFWKTNYETSQIQNWEFLLVVSNKLQTFSLTGNLPGRFMGKQMRDLFLWGGPSLVLARRHIQSAWVPLVVHIFPPFITYSSPFLTALVMMPESQRSGVCRIWKQLR